MDQAAFRALLSSSKPATNAATADASRALGSGSRKRRNDGSLATTHGGSTADKAAALKPRGQHAGKADTQKRAAESHKSTTDASKSSEPSYKRFGYVDRAAMRRAGLLDGEVEERPDLATLLGEAPVKEPAKTEEEAERELEEEENRLAEERRAAAEEDVKQTDVTEVDRAPPAKKSRQDKLRELQAKIAAAASQASEKPLAKQDPGADALQKPSFKVIDSRGLANAKKTAVVTATTTAAQTNETHANAAASDDEDDIFANAGDYHGGLSGEEESEGEEGQATGGAVPPSANDRIGEKLFDDQDALIPKFEAYRSPTPPTREEREAAQRKAAQDAEGGSQRLQGLSDSRSLTAKQLLELDDAAAKDEARKLKKLKGKDRKEAVAKEAELTGKNSTVQKEKDRLNREQQEYEKYERKRAGRG